MGGKSGGGARTPVEAPNTLWTAQSLRILDAVSEGVVEGFANGNDYPFKSIFFNDTPVQNPDGTYNFKGVNGYFLRGAQDQPYVPGFSATERSVAVATRVKKDVQVVRTITDDQVSRLRVTLGVNRNMQVQSNGDSVPTTTILHLELVNAAGVKATQIVNFTEKSSGVAYVDHVFSDLPATPFNLRVTRVTEDAKDDKTSNETYVSGYVEIIDAKLNYPHTALAALELDSDQFGSSSPRRNYLIKGRVVRVPSNYNPETRVYSGTLWDGTFKSAWTNNPAWVFYDLLTSERVSTLARRMSAADIDKWGLYKVAQYCDQLVDDGFGGKEPRFVCNAYIADTLQAGELLTDLASVFCGMPVWNGNQVSVTLDMDSDPVASYTNSNVVDGAFTYSGVALKAIHTAVHVQYVDKYDGYRTKTEYVEDSEAVKRYGLNIKSVTAFGCDSRGQASRFGAWILQTALRQQHALSFTVGREGMKHLPYDIIQVADNNYAGAQISGRVLAVAGRVLTLDKEVESAVGAMLSYVTEAGVKTVKVTAQPAGDKVQLETAVPIAEMDTWVLSEPVKSRLYRAIGVSENTSDGTYTIAALLHDPRKYAVVDGWADFDKEITTLHTLTPELINTAVAEEGGTLKVTWDSTTTSGESLSYDIVIYRNGQRYRELTSSTPEFSLEGLPDGDYYAEIRGKNARGAVSEPKVVSWSVNYTLTGLRTTPQLFAIGLNWVLPKVGASRTCTEIWYGTKNDISAATKLAALPYPQTTYTLTDVKISDRYWFWVRLVDDVGNSGEFTPAVAGMCSTDTKAIVEQVQGAITESSLSQELIDLLSDNDRKAQEAAELTAAGLVDDAVVATNARIASVEQAAATEKTAQALKNSSMESSIGANAAKVETQAKSFADLSGKISATYMMRVEGSIGGQPVVAGMSLGTDGKITNAIFNVQNFVVGDLQNGKIVKPFIVRNGNLYVSGDVFADGMILGKHIAADQTIYSPKIIGGDLDIGGGNFTVNGAGAAVARNITVQGGGININDNFIVTNQGELTAKSGRFEGEVYAGRLTGNVLSSYEVVKTGIGTYDVTIPPLEVNALIHVSFLVTSGTSPKAPAYDAGRILGTRRQATITCNGQQLIQYVYGVVDNWWYEYPKTYTTISENVQMCSGMFKVPRGKSISVSVVVRTYHGALLDATGVVIASVMPIK